MDASFIHLGHPLILPAKNRTSAYNFVLDKFKLKLSTYKADKLSHAARLELIKSVFSSIPVYYMSNILFSKKFISKLTAIIRTFWWTGIREEATTRSLCLKAWKDICAPKKEGGLGVRNLQAVNQSLILMSAWRIAQNPQDHLHLVLKAKYFPDSSIWRPNPNKPKSAFWASILKILPTLKAHTFYQLTQGNISIWSTPWCPSWISIYDELIIQPPGFVYPTLVKDLWLTDQRIWNEDLIDLLFTPAMAQNIKQTQIINTDEQDILCWKLTPNGKCNAKSAYRACVQVLYEERQEERPIPPSPDTVQLLNQVWNCNEIIPRIQTFAWRFLRKAMPIGDRAGRFAKHIDKLCCRCGLQEDDVHLFFTCPFAKAAWFLQPWYIRIECITQNCTSLTQIILNMLHMNHPHASLPNIFTFMWCIWKSRNDLLFGRRNGMPYQISINAQALRNNLELYDASSYCIQESRTKHRQKTGSETTVPHQGTTISSERIIDGPVIFADASWKCRKVSDADGRQLTGIGVFIRDDSADRKWCIMIQASVAHEHSVFQAEARALLLAATIARILDIRGPTFLTDNQVLAKIAASRKLDHHLLEWNARNSLANFFDVTSNTTPQVFHISRNLNGVAHKCAAQVLRRSLNTPIYACSSSTHSQETCPVVSILKNVNLQDFVLNTAWCT
jgi:hypothetical protein